MTTGSTSRVEVERLVGLLAPVGVANRCVGVPLGCGSRSRNGEIPHSW